MPADDIIETSNHFDLLDTINNPLSNENIKGFHRILNTGTSDAQKSWFAVGNWKKRTNEVGSSEITLLQNVETEMNKLNDWYNAGVRHRGLDPQPSARRSQSSGYSNTMFENIIENHYRFEKIHPFQDGNGRVRRLIMFRECLRNGVVPFIIDKQHKQFYYRGLKEFDKVRLFSGYLPFGAGYLCRMGEIFLRRR